MAENRIYLVLEEGDVPARLVKTDSPGRAVRHVVKNRFQARVATQEDLVKYVSSGVTVEETGVRDE